MVAAPWEPSEPAAAPSTVTSTSSVTPPARTTPPAPQPRGTIDNPAEGEAVTGGFSASGTVDAVPSDSVPWLIVEVVGRIRKR